MIWFVLGFIAGAGAALMFLAFIALVSDDSEIEKKKLTEHDMERERFPEIDDWYKSYY